MRWETCSETVAGVKGCFSESVVEGRRRERIAIDIDIEQLLFREV